MPFSCQLSDRLSSFPTSLAGEVERGLAAGQFPGPGSPASLGGTPDFIQFGERWMGGCQDRAETEPSVLPSPPELMPNRNSIVSWLSFGHSMLSKYVPAAHNNALVH